MMTTVWSLNTGLEVGGTKKKKVNRNTRKKQIQNQFPEKHQGKHGLKLKTPVGKK